MLMMSVTAYRSNAHNIIPMSVVWRPKCGVVCEVWCGVQTKCGVAPSVRSSVRPFRPSPSVSVRLRPCAHGHGVHTALRSACYAQDVHMCRTVCTGMQVARVRLHPRCTQANERLTLASVHEPTGAAAPE